MSDSAVRASQTHPPHEVHGWLRTKDELHAAFDWTNWLYTKPVLTPALLKLEQAYQGVPLPEQGQWWPATFDGQGAALKADILRRMLAMAERTEHRRTGAIQVAVPVNDELGNICRTFGCDPAAVAQWADADPAFHLALFIQNALQIHLARTYGLMAANVPKEPDHGKTESLAQHLLGTHAFTPKTVDMGG